MSRKLKKYSKEYKLSLLREYYSSGMTKYAFEKEHNLAPATFLRWLSAYESEKNCYLCSRINQKMICQTVVKRVTKKKMRN